MDEPLVLASASPRRRRLVGWLGVPFGVTSTDTPEDLSVALPPAELASSLAAEKAIAARDVGERGTIVAFDTIVVADGDVLGKPKDRDEARQMLRRLSGRTHEVVTGVAILRPQALDPEAFSVTTPVTMRELTDEAIEAWVAGDECLGCAGAYNIEHHLASVADNECFHNVAGLPLCHVYRALREEAPGMIAPVETCDAALCRECRLGPEVCGR